MIKLRICENDKMSDFLFPVLDITVNCQIILRWFWSYKTAMVIWCNWFLKDFKIFLFAIQESSL